MKISFVIPTLNQPSLLKTCLASLFAQRFGRLRPEVIVVFDGTPPAVQKKIVRFCQTHRWPVRFLRHRRPKGFCRSVNRGIKESGGEMVILLNDDLRLAPDWLLHLKKFWQKHQKEKIFGQALILDWQGKKVDTAGGRLLTCGRIKMLASPADRQPRKIQVVSATAAFYPRRFFEEVGLFDERFGSYLEDVDLSIRGLKAGWQGWLVPRAVVYHKGRATSQQRRAYKEWHDLKNWILLVFKHPKAFNLPQNLASVLLERLRNFSGFLKAVLKCGS